MKKLIFTLITFLLVSVMGFGQTIPISRTMKGDPVKTQQSNAEVKRKHNVSDKISDPDGKINGHGYVDLGLPSGLKWATCNVGASTPSGYGNYYAWGETKTKSSYDWSNNLTFNKTESELQDAGILNKDGDLIMSYDAAHVNWGGSWRMPTRAEMDELNYKCKWTWTSQEGNNGYKVTGPNGKSIFLPAAGHRKKMSLVYVGEKGDYWGASCAAKKCDGVGLAFSISSRKVLWYERFYGYTVRPVSNESKSRD